jgi:hypothetical protein
MTMTEPQKQALAHYKRVRGKKNLEEALALRALMQANKGVSSTQMIKILHGDDSKS